MGILAEQIISKMELYLENSWKPFMEAEMASDYFQELDRAVSKAYAGHVCYPAKEDIFHAFAYPASGTKVVILGQDPYHEKGQAMGLSFSVRRGVPVPPSLRNILTELEHDVGGDTAGNTDLTPWAKQGVFLLNTVLTVEEGKANSHAALGWKHFTQRAIEYVVGINDGNVVGILWGNHAMANAPLFKAELVITAPHPSPLSAYRGFFGSKPFSKANELLSQMEKQEIDWKLPIVK